MKFAYADPPYLGCCGLYDHHHPDGKCWDDLATHRDLVTTLWVNYDGWALSASSSSLKSALREQLAQAHKNVESLSQTIFRSEQATRMREACIEKVRAIADKFERESFAEVGNQRLIEKTRVDTAQAIVKELSSLTLDQGEQKQ